MKELRIAVLVMVGVCLTGTTSAAQPGAEGVTVSGFVNFEGTPPKRRPIDTRAEVYCRDMYADEPLLSDSAVIGENGEFAHIFVWIDNPPDKDYPVPEEPALLDQLGCRYTSPVFGMRAGQTLKVTNNDDTTHNVRGFPKNNRIFNFGQPPGLNPRTRVIENAEHPMKIKCDVHAWMRSYCFVMEHPFFGVTGLDGRFEITHVPPGTYVLKAWHERLGELKKDIVVGGSPVTDTDFTFRRPQ